LALFRKGFAPMEPVFKKPTETKKSASDRIGFLKNRSNSIKTSRNPFD
jgi:hypothetical protein